MNVLRHYQYVCRTDKPNQGYMWLQKEAQSRMNVLQQCQYVCCAENGNG